MESAGKGIANFYLHYETSLVCESHKNSNYKKLTTSNTDSSSNYENCKKKIQKCAFQIFGTIFFFFFLWQNFPVNWMVRLDLTHFDSSIDVQKNFIFVTDSWMASLCHIIRVYKWARKKIPWLTANRVYCWHTHIYSEYFQPVYNSEHLHHVRCIIIIIIIIIVIIAVRSSVDRLIYLKRF